MLSTVLEHQIQLFDVYGVGVMVTTDDDRPYRAIESFLEPFVTEQPARSELAFDISTSPRAQQPDPDAQEVWDAGYFRMSKSGSRRYLAAKGYGTGEADLDTGSGRIWVEGWGENYQWGLTRLLFLPMWAMLLKTTGRFTIHAAGVARDGRALLFPVRSGGGKSTLTLNLAKAGYDLLSDDTQFLIPEEGRIKIAPFTEQIALRKGSLTFFPEHGHKPVGEGHRVLVDPAEEGINVVSARVEPGIIAFPQLTGKPESVYEPISSAEALQRLILSSFFFTDQAVLDDHLQVLSTLVAQSSCYRVGVGTRSESLVECVQRMESES